MNNSIYAFHFSIAKLRSDIGKNAFFKQTIHIYTDRVVAEICGETIDITQLDLTDMGDLNKWDREKQYFFQVILNDGRKLVGYVEKERRQEFITAKKAIKAAKKAYKDSNSNSDNSAKKSSYRTSGIARQIESLSILHAQGVINDAEFEAAKRKILGI
ncbi:hypothetical protein C7B80_21515 [Cyanosarcina cf. burmensis CCALA 770]|nr:hypothetical protein C7B80_21515 [Cyanosarcina cf. burmensis CCALA 770]